MIGWAEQNAIALGQRIGAPPAPAPQLGVSPRHEWPVELARDVRKPQTEEAKARYYGFVRVNGDVDLHAFRLAVEAPWRKL